MYARTATASRRRCRCRGGSGRSIRLTTEALSSFTFSARRIDEPARVSETLRQHTFWQGRGGAVEHAISGIDIALWDLFGKVTSQPVARLLGGIYRDRIRPYGSLLFDEPDALAWKLNQATARGFRAI